MQVQSASLINLQLQLEVACIHSKVVAFILLVVLRLLIHDLHWRTSRPQQSSVLRAMACPLSLQQGLSLVCDGTSRS